MAGEFGKQIDTQCQIQVKKNVFTMTYVFYLLLIASYTSATEPKD